MDIIDRKLINLVQNGLPIESRPFLALAEELSITEREVIERLEALKKHGYIRRIGGIFDSKKLGYVSTLCAISVPKGKVEEVSKIINSYEEVTHNYIREHHYNMWFTLIASSKERIDTIIEDIKLKTSINELLNLPSIKLFKIKATFDVTGR
ncbi:AsnC family transcriptional regulator [Clostridiaceae bacterium UIB06]|uniref:siroheme decarboxylase n=1 Tax=Clostridium thailandense TaxID=2794346 RepID=A0A949TW40_9CLOT|nr:AsnC family transcriptional regulator [Clostridium thailandense]MBV7272941.1 AsnC family transcriptional regulator [Clostridium thailandense]MCH5136248.1 AsnC family transcriptional regulator [Clostridiaceae bacterium UIB06]